jgi:hypothetical protein
LLYENIKDLNINEVKMIEIGTKADFFNATRTSGHNRNPELPEVRNWITSLHSLLMANGFATDITDENLESGKPIIGFTPPDYEGDDEIEYEGLVLFGVPQPCPADIVGPEHLKGRKKYLAARCLVRVLKKDDQETQIKIITREQCLLYPPAATRLATYATNGMHIVNAERTSSWMEQEYALEYLLSWLSSNAPAVYKNIHAEPSIETSTKIASHE